MFNTAKLSDREGVPPKVDGMIVCPIAAAHVSQPECPSHLDPHGTGAYSHFTEKHIANISCDHVRRPLYLKAYHASINVYNLVNVRSDKKGADADERKVTALTLIESIDVLHPRIETPKVYFKITNFSKSVKWLEGRTIYKYVFMDKHF